ncbi:hypothetical protein ACFQRD_02440 [Brachybacterium sp. GCM10030268]|uniref:hypothetical protein n=1 Tax=Brachybacterium sp. GCM10030268 TaxID=3273382 RepID=UPI00360A0D4D
MSTGPQYTPTPQTPGPGGGRGTALLTGAIAFAVVFLLIVAITVGYLVVRSSGGSGGASPTSVSNSSTPADPETSEETEEPTAVEEELCWQPPFERTSSNPSGKLRGGGLEFIPPSTFTGRQDNLFPYFLNDTQVATAPVEESWISTLHVGKVEWQPGVDYPGDEAASERIVDCMFRLTDWGDATGRTLDDEVTEPVTVAGMPGYRTTATVNWQNDPLEKTDATRITVVVVDTDEGPSAFISEIAVGVTEHAEGAEEAFSSLTGLSG